MESPPGIAAVVARVQQAEGDPAAAAATLTAYLDAAATAPVDPLAEADARLLQAVVRAELGEHDQAGQSLEHALALAAPEGYRQAFVDGGAPVRALLVRQRRRGTEHPALVADLLGRFGRRAAGARAAATPLLDRLTERELAVLRLLSTQLSQREIARQLYVSVNTTRTHIGSIYRKLGATGRRDAVDRARRMGLL